ncbi:hypothetical protein ACFYYB_27950 [Streptomyces sp. NPDC002886]|uniref:hypothetical protein n=1 Tax=Streptomyces sp. NPDC002886 TaxID=3364667 RepID=UPI0036C9ACD8
MWSAIQMTGARKLPGVTHLKPRPPIAGGLPEDEEPYVDPRDTRAWSDDDHRRMDHCPLGTRREAGAPFRKIGCRAGGGTVAG